MRPATEEFGLVQAPCERAADYAVTAAAAATASSSQMLRRLTLRDFRNYRGLDLRLTDIEGPCPIVLAGPNGAGKTNLLEAISYLAPGRGIRGARIGEVTRIGAARPWTVSARMQTTAGVIEVGTGIQIASAIPADGEGGAAQPERMGERPPDGLQERRMVRIDGAPSRPAGLSRIATILWLTPQMDRLFVEGAAARRRFLDRLVLGLHGGHGREMAAYERAMRARLNLLTRQDRRHGAGGGDPAWLTALERQMAEHGVAVAAGRVDAIGHLTAQILGLPPGAFPKAGLALKGLLEAGLLASPALQVEEDFAARLAKNRVRDAESGRTCEGPHRSDMLATHMAKGLPANLCSTGEQKALLVGLLLANAAMLKAREDRAPILLLDEIAAHMDERHRRALFDSLLDLACQTWMTGTDMALFKPLGGDALRFFIAEGRLQKGLASGTAKETSEAKK